MVFSPSWFYTTEMMENIPSKSAPTEYKPVGENKHTSQWPWPPKCSKYKLFPWNVSDGSQTTWNTRSFCPKKSSPGEEGEKEGREEKGKVKKGGEKRWEGTGRERCH